MKCQTFKAYTNMIRIIKWHTYISIIHIILLLYNYIFHDQRYLSFSFDEWTPIYSSVVPWIWYHTCIVRYETIPRTTLSIILKLFRPILCDNIGCIVFLLWQMYIYDFVQISSYIYTKYSIISQNDNDNYISHHSQKQTYTSLSFDLFIGTCSSLMKIYGTDIVCLFSILSKDTNNNNNIWQFH